MFFGLYGGWLLVAERFAGTMDVLSTGSGSWIIVWLRLKSLKYTFTYLLQEKASWRKVSFQSFT